jgi:hypothetical protein
MIRSIMPDLEAALDQLYAAPLDEFTSRRNLLSKELRGASAATVKGVKKPNLAAWAVNQLARKHPSEVEEVFSVTDKLRHAQRRVLSGGKATELRKATDDRNKVIGRLKKLAAKILRDAGHSASASTLEAVGDTFMAVASDQEGGELVRKGRLSRELEPSAFIDVSGLTLVESPADVEEAVAPDLSRLHEARRIVSEARGAAKEARESYKEADRAAEKLLRSAEEAERQAKAASEEAEFARRAADARKGELEEVERQLEAAQAALKDLERD